MKRIFLLMALACMALSCGSLNQLSGLPALPGTSSGNTNNTAVKDLLLQSVLAGVGDLGNTNGFLNNQLYKILLPPEAQKVVSTLQSIGLGSVVNSAVTQINHSAESAVSVAKPIFVNAVRSMSISDAAGLVSGDDNAITDFFKRKTSSQLLTVFTPIIKKSLNKNEATKYYDQIAETYNKVPLVKNKLNPDLTNYVATQAMNAMFGQMSTAEKNIRHNPAAQTTAALKAVFGRK